MVNIIPQGRGSLVGVFFIQLLILGLGLNLNLTSAFPTIHGPIYTSRQISTGRNTGYGRYESIHKGHKGNGNDHGNSYSHWLQTSHRSQSHMTFALHSTTREDDVRVNELMSKMETTSQQEDDEYENNDDDNDNDNGSGNETNRKKNKRELAVSASITLPFSADVAFSAFADLPRQPTWSSWLHSVSYVKNDNENEIDTEGNTSSNSVEYTECGIPFQETKWVMKWKKLSFSWKSKVINLQRPNVIEWQSTSGLPNRGKIIFTERVNSRDDNDDDVESSSSSSLSSSVDTDMVLTMTFTAPRIVASVFRKSDSIKALMEEKMLQPTLVSFRKIVMEEDLGMMIDADDGL